MRVYVLKNTDNGKFIVDYGKDIESKISFLQESTGSNLEVVFKSKDLNNARSVARYCKELNDSEAILAYIKTKGVSLDYSIIKKERASLSVSEIARKHNTSERNIYNLLKRHQKPDKKKEIKKETPAKKEVSKLKESIWNIIPVVKRNKRVSDGIYSMEDGYCVLDGNKFVGFASLEECKKYQEEVIWLRR